MTSSADSPPLGEARPDDAETPGDPPGSHPITSIDNALRILTFVADRQSVRVIEVAEHVGVARSTAHRVLSALLARGFVVQGSHKLYHRGPFFDLVARGSAPRPDLVASTRLYMQTLAGTVGETVHLGVLQGNGVRFLYGVPGTKLPRVGLRTGMLLPAHLAAIGMALLAELPGQSLRALYPRGLDGASPRTTEQILEFERQIVDVRRLGYARLRTTTTAWWWPSQ